MYRFCFRTPRQPRFHHPRCISSSLSSSTTCSQTKKPPDNVKNSELVPPPPSSLSRASIIATFVSALLASVAIFSSDHKSDDKAYNPPYDGVEQAAEKSCNSFKKLFHHTKQTGVAVSVIWQSLSSVLSSANHEVRSGFEIRVAALLADIAAANFSCRAAIVGAGGGVVVDWLLDSVAVAKDGGGTQAESARALAYLIADTNVSAAVLGRPHAIPNLLRFVFSCQLRRSKLSHSRRSSFVISDSLEGRSMLVAAIMDIVTSSCDNVEEVSFVPSLPGNAETRDITAALKVVEEGGLHLDEPHDNDDDGGSGMKGIGIKIPEGTTDSGLSRTTSLMKLDTCESTDAETVKQLNPETLVLQSKDDNLPAQENIPSSVVPGLWDDLHCEHVAVPFATWALANWAMASQVNRSRIQELDQDGHAIMSALVAPVRSVKWHASLVARLLLEDRNMPLNDSVSEWSSSLLSTVSQACEREDISLAQMTLSAFLVSVERSPGAQEMVMEKGLNQMGEIVKRTTKHKHVQEALAKALELLCTGDLHLSLEESQKWSAILIPWVFGKFSSDSMRSSAISILSRILEDYGPLSVPVSQQWLTTLLCEVQSSTKKSLEKGTSQPENDKVKTLIHNSNIASAAQVANQLAAVANKFPLPDFPYLEPFAGPFKNLIKDSLPKLDAADSALATLKGIKASTEFAKQLASTVANTFPPADFLLRKDSLPKLNAADSALATLKGIKASTEFAKQLASTVANTFPPSDFLLRKDRLPKLNAADSALATLKGIKALTEVYTEDSVSQNKIVDFGILCLLRRFLLSDDYEKLAAIEAYNASRVDEGQDRLYDVATESLMLDIRGQSSVRFPAAAHIRRHAARLLTKLSLLPKVQKVIITDKTWCKWLDDCANGRISGCSDPKIRSYARAILLNVFCNNQFNGRSRHENSCDSGAQNNMNLCPRFEDMIFLINPHLPHWKCPKETDQQVTVSKDTSAHNGDGTDPFNDGNCANSVDSFQSGRDVKFPLLDVVFVHGLRGGPYKTWRIADDKPSTMSSLVEKIDQEAGKLGTFWPGEWLSSDFPEARLFSLKYKTNLTQWSRASLPLQEISSMLLEKLVAARIGDRPVVFVTHSMGGLVVKQMLYKAKEKSFDNLVKNTIGIVFYSCPHFGSKLADIPWQIDPVLRPAPALEDLRSGSSRLVEPNNYIRQLHEKGELDVLSFCETKETPIAEVYGGWALRTEIVSIESAYPGFGERILLESTDHINSCKPATRTDPSYAQMLEFLRKLKASSTVH